MMILIHLWHIADDRSRFLWYEWDWEKQTYWQARESNWKLREFEEIKMFLGTEAENLEYKNGLNKLIKIFHHSFFICYSW